MKFGTSDIKSLYCGSTKVSRVYLGTSAVYDESDESIDPDTTILDPKVYSSFSDSNYLTCSNFLNNTQENFEVKSKICMISASTANCSIIDTLQENSSTAFRFEINSENKLQARFSNVVGNFEYFLTLTGTTVLQLNTWYYAKVTYNSTNGYALYLTEDELDWGTAEATSSITTLIGTTLNTLLIGDNAASGSSFPGSINLSETVFKVNGATVFDGATAVAGTDYTVVGSPTLFNPNVLNISQVGLTAGLVSITGPTRVFVYTDVPVNNPDTIGLTTGLVSVTHPVKLYEYNYSTGSTSLSTGLTSVIVENLE